jgi:hypothetical protein
MFQANPSKPDCQQSGFFVFSNSFGQDQLALPGGLQTVNLAQMADEQGRLARQQIAAFHGMRTFGRVRRCKGLCRASMP